MIIDRMITDLGVFELPERQAQFHLQELSMGYAVDEAKTEADVVFG